MTVPSPFRPKKILPFLIVPNCSLPSFIVTVSYRYRNRFSPLPLPLFRPIIEILIFYIFRGLPLLFNAIFGVSPRISFAFSHTHTLIGSYLFQKGRAFLRSFGFSIFKLFSKYNGAFKSSIIL